MAQGRTVVFNQTDSINDSFYDVFSRRFEYIDKKMDDPRSYYANIVVGSHIRQCQVHPNFECILVVKKSELDKLPTAFLGLFEKYYLTHSSIVEAVKLCLPEQLKSAIQLARKEVCIWRWRGNRGLGMVGGGSRGLGMEVEGEARAWGWLEGLGGGGGGGSKGLGMEVEGEAKAWGWRWRGKQGLGDGWRGLGMEVEGEVGTWGWGGGGKQGLGDGGGGEARAWGWLEGKQGLGDGWRGSRGLGMVGGRSRGLGMEMEVRGSRAWGWRWRSGEAGLGDGGGGHGKQGLGDGGGGGSKGLGMETCGEGYA